MDGYRSSRSSSRTQSQIPSKPSNFSPINDNLTNSVSPLSSKQNSVKPSSSKVTSQKSISKSTSSKQSSSKSHSLQSSLSNSLKSQATSSSFNSLKQHTGAASSRTKFEERERRKAVSSKSEDDRTVKNPDLVKPEKKVDNSDLINGLALQRQWDEKPDIDHLSNSLLSLYYKLEANKLQEESNSAKETQSPESKDSTDPGETNEDVKELREKIFLSALRVPKIEKSYYGKCRKYQKRKSLNEVYEKLSRVVSKLPNMRQIQLITKELMNKMSRINGRIEKIRSHMESQKSHILNVTQLLSNITSSSAT